MMKVIFAGTPDFSVPILEALHHSQHEVVAVYTQPDRPAGRGRQLTPSPIKQFALQQDFFICQPENFNDQETLQQLQDLKADIMVVVGYGILLPITVLNAPARGCINIHPSLLPKYPGLNTHQKAIKASDKLHGATVHFVTEKLDGGPIICKEVVNIDSNDTKSSLAKKVLEKEHILYPKVIHWYTQNRLKLKNDSTATLDGKNL